MSFYDTPHDEIEFFSRVERTYSIVEYDEKVKINDLKIMDFFIDEVDGLAECVINKNGNECLFEKDGVRLRVKCELVGERRVDFRSYNFYVSVDENTNRNRPVY